MKFKRISLNNRERLLVLSNDQWFTVGDLPNLQEFDNDLLGLLKQWPKSKDLLESGLKHANVAATDIPTQNHPLLPFQRTMD